MSQTTDIKIKNALGEANLFTVVSHIRPDGDAIGSMLALGTALKNAGKKVHFVLQDKPGSRYDYLVNFAEIMHTMPQDAGYLIVVDCSDAQRTGEILGGRKPDLVIDHHKTNAEFGIINLIEPDTEATCLVLAQHLPAWGFSVDSGVANALLTGIVADTIGFRTSNTSPNCLKKAAELMEAGANLAFVYQRVLLSRSLEELRYWGQGLSKLNLDDGLLWTSLSLADRMRAGYEGNDDADLVNNMTTVSDMFIAVICVEQSEDRTKVSWRSREGFDVSALAREFGGGGHAAAAGADLSGDLQSVMDRVLARTRQYLIETRGIHLKAGSL
ncbi:MAG: DHH family phosphoesterase [Anaerolineaceae bacterium]|nr:DHH family phosphoesterase [Anaerolineaceae bacterium]